MLEQEWTQLVRHLHKAACALFNGRGDWEDAAQEACRVICSTGNVRYPKALGAVVIRRVRNAMRRRDAHFKELVDSPCRAGFDAGMLAGDWIEQARERIPPTYRGVVLDIDLMSRLHGVERSNAVAQRCFKAKRMMWKALAKTA